MDKDIQATQAQLSQPCITNQQYTYHPVELPQVNSFQPLTRVASLFTTEQSRSAALDSDILVRRNVVQLFKSVISGVLQSKPRKTDKLRLIEGASGLGKTTTMLLLSDIALQHNMVLFYINCREFVSPEVAMETRIITMLQNFLDINKSTIQQDSKIYSLIKQITKRNAIVTLRQVVETLKTQIEWPVMICADDCDAFTVSYSVIIDDKEVQCNVDESIPRGLAMSYSNACHIGQIFQPVDTLFMQYGMVIFTYSSSRNIKDWYRIALCEQQIYPMMTDEWRLLVLRLIESKKLPTLPGLSEQDSSDEYGRMCGFLPGELRSYLMAYKNAQQKQDVSNSITMNI